VDNTGAVTYYDHDQLGSTVGSSSGESTRYWPYGATRSGSVASTAYRFTGQRQDVAGLYFYQSRWYDAGIGRFLQPDPLIPDPGDPQSLNRYAYVCNNPLRYTDPTGHVYCQENPYGDYDSGSCSDPSPVGSGPSTSILRLPTPTRHPTWTPAFRLPLPTTPLRPSVSAASTSTPGSFISVYVGPTATPSPTATLTPTPWPTISVGERINWPDKY